MELGYKKKNNLKEVYYREETLDILKKGINDIANIVTTTLGPGGRNIIIEDSMGNPTITKDGVTVAKSVKFPKPYSLGADMMKLASKKIAEECGDGTTTVMLLTQVLLNESIKLIESGYPLNQLLLDYKQYCDLILNELSKIKIDITNKDLFNIDDIIKTSTNDDKEITKLISEAYKIVGETGLILVDESKSNSSFLKESQGYSFNAGYYSSQFLKDKTKNFVVYKDAKVLIYDKKIDRLEHIKDILISVAQDKVPIIIIAEDFDTQVLSQLIMNLNGNYLDVMCIKAPSYGENRNHILADIAAITDATLISQVTGIALWESNIQDLGEVEQVTIKQNEIIFENPKINQEKLNTQILQCQSIIDNKDNAGWEIEQAKKRQATLTDKTVTIMVGGYTEISVKEKMDRYDDAIKALKTAINGGILPGGGLALYRIYNNLYYSLNIPGTVQVQIGPLENFTRSVNTLTNNEKKIFESLVKSFLLAPINKIFNNLAMPLSQGTLEQFNSKYYTIKNANIRVSDNLKDTGCIDPYLVTYNSVLTAFNVATTILLSGGIILQPLTLEGSALNELNQYEMDV